MKHIIDVVNVDTDVLIIGGGLAGCMAGIKASEAGVKVTIAEKANTLSSGCAGTGVDHAWAYIPPVHEKMGWSIDDLVEDHVQLIARGFIKKEILRLIAREGYNRMLDLEKFGIQIRYEDSKIPGKFRVVYQFHTMPSSFNFNGYNLKIILTREARKRGVDIINRVNMIALLINNRQISGALGVGTNNGKLYVFRAKTIIVSTGRANRLTPNVTGIWGNHRIPVNETGDGRAIAFRAGVPVINMEFLSSGYYSIGNYELNLGSPRNTVQPAAAVVDAVGKVIVPRTQFYDWKNLGKEKIDAAKNRREALSGRGNSRPSYEQLYQKGEGPFYLDLTGVPEDEIKYIEWSISNEGKGSLFLDYLKNQEGFDFRKDKLEWLPNSREMAGTAASGLLTNDELETEVKGLYAAGDDVGGVPWSGAPGAFVMGWSAGEKAASQAKLQKNFLPIDTEKVYYYKNLCSGILANRKGMHWREIEMAVQNVVNYYAGNTRAARTLKRGVERLDNIKEKASFRADNPHELLRCLEVKSILDNAEMILKSSLERQESRRAPFGFIRADFPEQDDVNWLAFLALKKHGDKIEFSRVPIKN